MGDFSGVSVVRYGSVCSGIEAATMGWHHLGWEPAFFSEIEEFPRQVLAHHYPDTPCHGDFTTIKDEDYGSIQLLVGGTPCQSFSIAGLRGGMADERGNLALEYLKLAQRKRPRWLVWENVPGVLSSDGGRDFGAFLGGLVECGYGFAYRVLDAQYFGVAQRRRRVFVVGYLGDWRRAAAVLFERESLLGNPAPSREEGEKVAPAVTTGPPFSRTGNERVKCEAIVPVQIGSGSDPQLMATLCAKDSDKWGCNQWVNEGKAVIGFQSTANAVAIQAQALKEKQPDGQGFGVDDSGVSYTLTAGDRHAVSQGLSVRRLTPTECERLQGFPDNFTQIPYRGKPAEKCPDGPRYKALGNSMAVPCMAWIGERIQQVEAIACQRIQEAVNQPRLFDEPEQVPEQEVLL